MSTDNLPLPPKLPGSVEEFRALRKVKSARTLNDLVEEVHLGLYDTEKYSQFLYAVYDEQAIEGSLSADNIMAASMIREKAKSTGKIELAREKLATIAKSLGVVLRRYSSSRHDRRNMIGGEVVPGGDGDGGK